MKYFIFVLALFTNNYCLAQKTFSFNQGGATIKNYYVEIPYQMVSGKILIDVELGGQKHKFIFDTGAPTAINASLTKQIKATGLGKTLIKDIGGKSDSLGIVKVDGLKLGNVTFSDVPVLTSIPAFMDCFQADGVIGSNLLRNSIVGIQIVKRVLVITDQPEKLMLDKKYAAPMTLDSIQSFPQIAVNLNGLVGTIPFDTGAGDFMTFREEWIQALQDKHIAFEITDKGFGSNAIGMFGHQPDEVKQRLKFPAIQIGNARFEHVHSETTKDGTPIIGTHLLDYGNIVLDYINKQYYFFPKTATIDMEEKHWPIGVTIKDGKLLVSMVWSACKDVLQPGEQILSAEGKDYSHVDICDYITKQWTDNRTSVTLVIKDAQGKTRTVKIDKQ